MKASAERLKGLFEAALLLAHLPLGYRTEDENKLLGQFADKAVKAIMARYYEHGGTDGMASLWSIELLDERNAR